MEYLNMFIKEVLRIDGAGDRTFIYRAIRDFESNEMLIPKDTLIYFNIQAFHRDENQWHDPSEFIPERFDASSKYFKKPDGGKRSIFAY
jgi:cytochrome P450